MIDKSKCLLKDIPISHKKEKKGGETGIKKKLEQIENNKKIVRL